jgi:hypothetical protein
MTRDKVLFIIGCAVVVILAVLIVLACGAMVGEG